jgi:hypothetical protein
MVPSPGVVQSSSGSISSGPIDLSSSSYVTNRLSAANGGTGVKNGANTLTLTGGNFTFTTVLGSSVTVPASGTLALDPMTTLGDMTYEGTPPTAVRLAGNTSTTKKFLTQTGTGTVSAAPAWGTISNSDVSGLGTMSTQNATAVAITGGTGTFTNSASIAAALSGTNAFTGSSINGAIAGQFTSSGTNTAASNIAILASAFGNGGSTNYALYAALGDVDINQGNFTQVSGTMFLGDGAGNTVDMLFYAGNGVPGDRELILPATTGTGSTNLFLPDEGTSNNTFMVTSGTHSATFNGLSADRVYTLPDANATLATTSDITNGTVTYGGSNATEATGASDLFNVSYSPGANTSFAGAAITSNGSGSSGADVTSTGLTVSATGKGAGTVTGLSVSASGGTRNNAISATGDVSITGNLSATATVSSGTSTGTIGEIQLNNGAGETVTIDGTNAAFNPTFHLPGESDAGPFTLATEEELTSYLSRTGGTMLGDVNIGDHKVVGGTLSTSTLTLQSTSATGSTDAINMVVGTNGGTQALNIADNGTVGIGSTQQLTVDNSGNLSTSGTITLPSATPTVIFGTAGNNRTLNFKDGDNNTLAQLIDNGNATQASFSVNGVNTDFIGHDVAGSITVSSVVSMGGHEIASIDRVSTYNSGSKPTAGTSSASVTTAPSFLLTPSSDMAGEVTFSTTGAAAGDFAAVTFASPYTGSTTTIVVVTPADQPTAAAFAAAGGYFTTAISNTGFEIGFGGAVANGAHSFYYHIIGQ